MNIRKNVNRIIAGFVIIIILAYSFCFKVHAEDSLLQQVKDTLIKYYIGDVPEEVLNATSIEEIYEFLGDPYTQYFTAGEFQEFINTIDMSFIGVGINIEMIQEGALVTSVMLNSPAMDIGIKENDIILSANEYIMSGLPYSEALRYINGIDGKFTVLKILSNGKILEKSIMPRKIFYPTVTGEVINKHIGYMRINSFGSITGQEFNAKLYELKNKKVDSFIIDLRNNTGGYLYSAINIAGSFIGKNTVMILEDKVNGRYSLRAENTGEIINEPVIFLMNEFTASSAEILLGAVRYYKKDFFIGENTYGKGVAQSMFKFEDGSVLKTSTLKFCTPNGKEINSTGISPNIKINNVDPIFAAELLLSGNKTGMNQTEHIKLNIDDKEFLVFPDIIQGKDYWEAYRLILGSAKSFTMVNNKVDGKKAPKIQFSEMPSTSYKLGNRISFKLSAPNYSKKIQYRAVLWEEATNSYRELWSAGDHYYNGWIPSGNQVFTIGFNAVKPGNYRIQFFAKRAGIGNRYTALPGLECDSYIGEIPFVINPS